LQSRQEFELLAIAKRKIFNAECGLLYKALREGLKKRYGIKLLIALASAKTQKRFYTLSSFLTPSEVS
jgi:hypothetical protein